VTYFLQATLKFSPIQTGLAFLPMVVMLVVAAQLSTNLLFPRLGAKVMVPIGMILGMSGMLLLTRLTVDSVYVTDVLPGLVLLGLAMGS
ncbi:MFS transporter, partial [Acinetobacter baumannii]